jgi:Flp pilus assembly protein TadD
MNNERDQIRKEHAEFMRRMRQRKIRRIALWSFCIIAVVAVMAMKKGFFSAIQRKAQQRAVMASASVTMPTNDVPVKVALLVREANKQLETNKPQEAVKTLQQVVELTPQYLTARLHLGMLLTEQGRSAEAVEQYVAVLRHNSRDPVALNNLADICATDADEKIRDGKRAVVLAERACEVTQRNSSVILGTLAAAYAENGLYSKAAQTVREAITLANRQSMPKMGEVLKPQLACYERGQPFRKHVSVMYTVNTSPAKNSRSAKNPASSLSPLEQQLQ